MSITFKASIKKNEQRKDGTWQVKIRLTKDRVISWIPTNFYVSKAQISRRSYEITDTDILSFCNAVIGDFREIINRMGDEVNFYDVKYLAKHLIEERARKLNAGIVDLIYFGKKHVEKLNKELRIGYAKNIEKTLSWLEKHYTQLPINRITTQMLENIQIRLLETMSQTSANIHLRNIRTLFNACADEIDDDTLIRRYPFRRFKFRPDDKPREKAVSIDTIRKIIFFPPHKLHRVNMARDVFTLSFVLLGMNGRDLYCCREFDGERIGYVREKTKRKGEKAFIAPLVPQEIMPVFEAYRDPSGERVFDFYKRYSTGENFIRAVNKGLDELCKEAGIEEDVTTYTARHSFATIARNECGVSKDDISMCLTHSSGLDITDRYIEKDWKIIDRVQEAVIGLVFGSRKFSL